MPRQLVACVMDGQVGVESTGVCGPVRTEAGDWHTAHATRGLNADALTAALALVHPLETEVGHKHLHPGHGGVPRLDPRQRFVNTSQSGKNTWGKRICLFFSCCPFLDFCLSWI